MSANIARPYAKAAFEYADAAQQLNEWSAVLTILSQAVKDPDFQRVLHNPQVSPEEVLDILMSVTPVSHEIHNFLKIIAEHNRFSLLPDIATQFQQQVAAKEGYLPLTVITAHALEKSQQAEVKNNLMQQFNTDVHIQYQVDKDIMDGMIVRSDQWVLDDSIRGRLQRLQAALVN